MGFDDWKKENAGLETWQQENVNFKAWQQGNPAATAPDLKEASPIGGGNAGWGAQIFGTPEPGSQFEGRKTMWQSIKHGWEVGGMMAVEGLAGLVRMEAEFSDHTPSPMGVNPPPKAYRDIEKKDLIKWSEDMLEAVDIAQQENPEIAMQLNEDDGFIDTTFDIVSHPEKLLQGVVEAVPLMAEAVLGNIVASPVGGVAVMAQPFVGKTYGRARQEGTDPLPAFVQASLTGYGEAAIEQWTFGKKLGLAKGFREIVEKGAGKVIWEGTKLYGRGMAEEGTQQFNENLWRWVFTDRSQVLTEGVVQAMAVGGPLELTMGGGFAGVGYATTPKQVPNSEKLKRIEALRQQVDRSSISEEGKAELNKEFDKIVADVNAGEFDKAPADVKDGATPEKQEDAADNKAASQEVLLEKSRKQQQEVYDELLEQAQEGDEVAAQKLKELQIGEPFEGVLEAAQEAGNTGITAAERSLPTYEVVFAAMLEGDEDARAAIRDGNYKEAKEAVNQLRPEKVDPFEGVLEAAQEAGRGNTPVNASIKATEEQQRKTAIGQAHIAARLLNINKKERYKIQKRITGIESLGKMGVEDSRKVRDYFQAELKKRGMSVSTGLELADAVKNNTTQKQVKEVSGIPDPAWKRILSNPRKESSRFIEQMTRIERMLEALDGYTEGPIYNSIWKVVHLQLVNSRVSKSRRINAFRDALVDIMTPELNTPEGMAAAQEFIQAEDKAANRKVKKLGKKALRTLVGDSLWAKHVTRGRTVILEATDADPKLSLNASERIGVYLAMKNENSRIHLLKGNFAAFTNPDLAMIAVLDALSSQEKEIAEWILTDLEANFSRANQAAILGLNRELEQRDNYFPMRVIDVADMKKDDFLTMLESHPKIDTALNEPGEVKKTVKGADQPINLDSFEVYLNHISRIEQFIHMAPVAKSVGNILRTKEFRRAVSNVTSGFGPNILDRWLKNCIRGHAIDKVDGFASRTLLWLRMKGMMHVLVGNIPSVARQFLSGFNGVASHPVLLAYATTNLIEVNNPKVYKLLQQRMIDKSDTMRTRSFERELANVRYYAQVSRVLMGKKEFSEIALSWQKWADKRTVTIVWNSAYDAALNNESVQKQFELDGSEEAAVYFADKMAMRTQPMGDVEHLPDFFTDGPIERLLSTFMNQPNNNLNFWAHDIIGMRKAGKIDNKMVAYRALMSSILPAMMFGAISRGGLPDDWKDAAFDMTVYTLGSVFLVGRMVVDAMLGFAGGKTAVEDIIPANFGKALQAGIKAAGAKDSEERKKHLKKVGLYTAKTAGALTGLLPNQAIRSAGGARALLTGETDDLRRLIYSDWSLTQYGWPDSKEEEKIYMKR